MEDARSRLLDTLVAEYTRRTGDAPDARGLAALAYLACATTKYGTGPFTVAFDLDGTALDFPHQLVPLATKLAAAGGRIGVITANQHPDQARQYWDTLGYPTPDFWYIFPHQDTKPSPEQVGVWKAGVVTAEGVDLLIDDFQNGKCAEPYRNHAGNHLGLQLLLPPGSARAKGRVTRAQTIERAVRKFAVPATLLPAVVLAMGAFDPDEYDPQFLGQMVSSLYFDTADGRLRAAKLRGQHYVTLRLRQYPGEVFFLEAKTETTKLRVPIDPLDAAEAAQGGNPKWYGSFLKEVDDAIQEITGGQSLLPVATVTYRRYARQTKDTRLTLDLGLACEKRTYPEPVLECKFEGTTERVPALDALPLIPINLSKFLWATE